MPISQFEQGKQYRLDTNKIREEEEPKPFWNVLQRLVGCSQLEIGMNAGQTITFNGYFVLKFLIVDNTRYVDVIQKSGNQLKSMFRIEFDDFQWVNFVYDTWYALPSNLQEYCNLIKDTKRALVAIYDHLSTKENKWVDLPCPSDYQGSASTLVDSARNTQGIVVADVIKSDVAKIELKWNFLTVAEYSKIAKLFEPAYYGGDTSVFMRACSFFDVIKGSWNGSTENQPDIYNNKCKVFYPSDRKVKFAKMVLNDNGSPKGYQDVSLNLIDTGKIYGE